MKNRFTLSLLFSTGLFGFLHAQSIVTDSKGKGVFTYYSTAAARLDLSGSDFAVTFSRKPVTTAFLYEDTNLVKKGAWFFTPSLISAEERLNVTAIKDFQPGAKAIVGYQAVVDTIYDRYNGPTYGWGLNGYISFDNFLHYNPGNNQISRTHPLSAGVSGNLTWFPGVEFFLANVTGDFGIGWNENALTSYKDSVGLTKLPNGVSFTDFDGKYGVLKEKMFKGRVTGSLLFIIPKRYEILSHICFGPYGELIYNTQSKNNFFSGFFVNVLAKPINYKKFRMPSTLGVIVEWNDKVTGPLVFLKGSITIGEFK